VKERGDSLDLLAVIAEAMRGVRNAAPVRPPVPPPVPLPGVARWRGDIHRYFPATVVRVMRKDAFVRPDLKKQSGSMAVLIVYSSIFGAVMASLPVVKTHMVVFDTAVVDLAEQLRRRTESAPARR